MNTTVSAQFAYQLMNGDEFWMSGRMYTVASARENEYGTITILFTDTHNIITDHLMMRVPRNTPFEIQTKM